MAAAQQEEQPEEQPEENEEPQDEQPPKEEENNEAADEEEAPKEEEAKAADDEAPKEEEAPQEEAPQEEEEAPKQPEPEPEPEPKNEPEPVPEPEPEQKKEEPKQEPKKKKKKGRKRKSKKGGGNTSESLDLWKKISAKKGSENDWYLCKLDGKVGTTTNLTLVQEGSGGAKEIVEFLTDKEKSMMFGLLRCVTTDDSKSVRLKFIYLRFVGTKVKSINKAKLTPSLGKIDDQFPCKHLTVDLNEKCGEDLAPGKLAKELLRIGGAHKPDKMAFGPDQEVLMKDM